MKTIGIVGGVAWPSSIVYYRTINELVARRLGGLHCANLVLAHTDFAEIERQQRDGRWDSPVPIIDTATAHAEAAVDIALASD